MEDDLLNKIRSAIEAEVTPGHREAVEDVTDRALKIMYHETTHKKIFDDISNITVKSDPQRLSVAVAGLLTMMRHENGPGFPDNILVPASSLIMCDVIDFLEQTGSLKPNTNFVGNAFEELFAVMMQKIGIGADEIQGIHDAQNMINPIDADDSPPIPEAPPDYREAQMQKIAALKQQQAPQGVINQAARR